MSESLSSLDVVVSLAKRRGFVYPACEIYGGFANAYSFGPYGVELRNNIKKLWWKMFVNDRSDIVGMDGPILLHSRLWEASGHTTGFNDAMVDCKKCKKRFRADHLVEEATGKDMEGDFPAMNEALRLIPCSSCGANDWTDARQFNMMFHTSMNGFSGDVFLRPETAGAIFVDFKNIVDSMRVRVPFGVAQIGKAFRNEIVAGNFIFRLREFEQMEIEYFIRPEEKWEELFEQWLVLQERFAVSLGASTDSIRRYEHPKEKLSHYSKKTIDIEYKFPFGFKELFGLACRGDFDLSSHAAASGVDLSFRDPETGQSYVPHVLEPTFGLDRSLLVTLCAAYHEEQLEKGSRIVMKFPFALAPVKVAVFPLLKNKPELVAKAREIFDMLKTSFVCEFDDNGNVGKRYRRQDEIGTPFCVTVDFDSFSDGAVTVRDRDTMVQERVSVSELSSYLSSRLG
ncbi:MAG: glycine--tRNA ligase [Candidatus Moranbacteria bacterium]|nr:glycine--tRNA ligase [Candidatus Moranbacteria bacterium]